MTGGALCRAGVVGGCLAGECAFQGWLSQEVAPAACFADGQLSGAREEVPAAERER